MASVSCAVPVGLTTDARATSARASPAASPTGLPRTISSERSNAARAPARSPTQYGTQPDMRCARARDFGSPSVSAAATASVEDGARRVRVTVDVEPDVGQEASGVGA